MTILASPKSSHPSAERQTNQKPANLEDSFILEGEESAEWVFAFSGISSYPQMSRDAHEVAHGS